MIELKQEQEKVILVAVSLQGQNDVESSLDELAEEKLFIQGHI